MSASGANKSLLVEVGVEEMPARVVTLLGTDFARRIEEKLIADGFKQIADSKTQWFATPRRLAVRLSDIVAQLPPRTIERKGPALTAAYDDNGKSTSAAMGFAESCGVAVSDLEQKNGRLYHQYTAPGLQLHEKLGQYVEQALSDAPLSERMRWGDKPYTFIRPLHWVLALHADTPLQIEVMGIRSGGGSYGHRFYHPDRIVIKTAEAYEHTLETEGKVIVAQEKRQTMIKKMYDDTFPAADHVDDVRTDFLRQLGNLYANDSDSVIDALVAENAAMVEWPYPICGLFDKTFCHSLPQPVIIQALMKNQKFFLGPEQDKNLSNRFLIISNVKGDASGAMQKGFERVAHPRLNDAAFFLRKDIGAGLDSHLSQLARVVFHRELGTLADKSDRLGKIAATIARLLQSASGNIKLNADALARAALLCKADLMTDTVREYPALEGEIGAYCLRQQGHDTVADIIAEHYMPRQAGGSLPQSMEGNILATADRLDTLAGIFAIGIRPSGSKDPFALRRAAMGMIRLILSLGERVKKDFAIQPAFNLFALIDTAIAAYQRQLKKKFERENIDAVKTYLLERMRAYYPTMDTAQALSPDQVEAAMSIDPEYLLDFNGRLMAINRFGQMPQMETLVAANKRISNILRKNADNSGGEIDESILEDEAEWALYKSLQSCSETVKQLAKEQKYMDTLDKLVGLHAPIDRFFDEVLVMDKDKTVQRNRINLLHKVRTLFMCIGDFSKLKLRDEHNETGTA